MLTQGYEHDDVVCFWFSFLRSLTIFTKADFLLQVSYKKGLLVHIFVLTSLKLTKQYATTDFMAHFTENAWATFPFQKIHHQSLNISATAISQLMDRFRSNLSCKKSNSKNRNPLVFNFQAQQNWRLITIWQHYSKTNWFLLEMGFW